MNSPDRRGDIASVSRLPAAAGRGRTAAAQRQRTSRRLRAADLHRRFWAAHGVQVIEQNGTEPVSTGATLYLLVPHDHLVLFEPEVLTSTEPAAGRVRFFLMHAAHGNGYRERAIADTRGRFLRFERSYARPRARQVQLAITRDPVVAMLWRRTQTHGRARLRLLLAAPCAWLRPQPVHGWACDRKAAVGAHEFLRALPASWTDPGSMIARECGSTASAPARTEPAQRPTNNLWQWRLPASGRRSWQTRSPETLPRATMAQRHAEIRVPYKRLFDVVLAILALALTLPLFPLIALAIALEDGWPLLFVQRRETVGGREFPCLKFRSMRKDADAVKADLEARNHADGPQFHLPDDPRVLRVGRLLRASKLDELPQLLNVLCGQMSIVGPRPSPFRENQYCPAWREARLSVRPGLTGLWQVLRTRRPGSDFQEWIEHDLTYVREACWRLDIWILVKTLPVIVLGR